MANMQNICREWGEIPPRNSVWEGFFRGQGPCLCVEDLLLPPSLWIIYQGTNKWALENFVGTMQEVTTHGCTPDPLPDSCRHLWYSHIFSLLILLSSQQPLWSVPPHYGDWRSFPAVRWDSHVIRALQTTLIGLPHSSPANLNTASWRDQFRSHHCKKENQRYESYQPLVTPKGPHSGKYHHLLFKMKKCPMPRVSSSCLLSASSVRPVRAWRLLWQDPGLWKEQRKGTRDSGCSYRFLHALHRNSFSTERIWVII